MTADNGVGRRAPKWTEANGLSPKEQKEFLSRVEMGEKFPVVERRGEIGPEVKDWLTELETGADIQLPKPVTDDKTGQVLVKPAAPQKPKIVLPLDEPSYTGGFTKTVYDSIRWLVEWIRRIILMFPERTVFRK